MSFTYPLMLIGLAAILVPIILHLFNFRRYKTIYFSNVKMLEDIQKKTKRASQIQQLIVLLLRILGIACLALAFAQPFLHGKTKTTKKGNVISIFVDNSYSMEANSKNGSRLFDAVDAANRMLAPGLNEHQTGLAVDFIDNAIYSAYYDSFDDSYMKDTELYAWLKEHCAEYGFILRYPEGKEQFYGVACEHPAHFRYVGKEAAKYITEHDLCLEEFIMLYDADKIYVPQP